MQEEHRDGLLGSGALQGDDEHEPLAETVKLLLRLILYNAWLLANLIMARRFSKIQF